MAHRNVSIVDAFSYRKIAIHRVTTHGSARLYESRGALQKVAACAPSPLTNNQRLAREYKRGHSPSGYLRKVTTCEKMNTIYQNALKEELAGGRKLAQTLKSYGKSHYSDRCTTVPWRGLTERQVNSLLRATNERREHHAKYSAMQVYFMEEYARISHKGDSPNSLPPKSKSSQRKPSRQ